MDGLISSGQLGWSCSEQEGHGAAASCGNKNPDWSSDDILNRQAAVASVASRGSPFPPVCEGQM